MTFLFPDNNCDPLVANNLPSCSQHDFVEFIVRNYFIEPSKTFFTKRNDGTDLLLPAADLNQIFPEQDIAEVAGNICDRTQMIELKHTQSTQGFEMLPKKLFVPTLVAFLLQQMILKKAGVFVSSTTFEILMSKATNSETKVRTLWLEAQGYVEQKLSDHNLTEVMNRLDACQTGVQAILRQGSSEGQLHTLWRNGCAQLCSVLEIRSPNVEKSLNVYRESINDACALRLKIARSMEESRVQVSRCCEDLYATFEAELCGCVVFCSFVRQLTNLFGWSITSKDQLILSSEVNSVLFVACLNVFTYFRYTLKSSAAIFPALDAVLEIARGRALLGAVDLRNVKAATHNAYLRRAVVCSVDNIGNTESLRRLHNEPSVVSGEAHFRFKDLNIHLLNMGTLCHFPTSRNSQTQQRENILAEDSSLRGVSLLEQMRKNENLTCAGEIELLSNNDDACLKYVLLEEERVEKKKIFEKIRALKGAAEA